MTHTASRRIGRPSARRPASCAGASPPRRPAGGHGSRLLAGPPPRLAPDGPGDAGRGTRWADWLDLLVPFLVLLPALGTLLSARVPRATYVWFAVGSWLYATGHGIHLAANSIGNVAPGRTAHLWDEQVGHWLWYAGVAVVAATLASTLVDRSVPRNPLAWLLALAVGTTWGTNATGGEFTWAGLTLAVAAAAWGLRHRDDRGVLLVAVGAAGAVATVASAIVR